MESLRDIVDERLKVEKVAGEDEIGCEMKL